MACVEKTEGQLLAMGIAKYLADLWRDCDALCPGYAATLAREGNLTRDGNTGLISMKRRKLEN